MFKIPTYEELERKETEQIESNKNYKQDLFQKRKNDESILIMPTKPKTTTTIPIESETHSPPKIAKAQSSSNNEAPISIDDDDDDDNLLNDFILNNKDIIERTSSKEPAATNVDSVFKKPTSFPAATTSKTSTTTNSAPVSYGNSGSGALMVNSKQRGNPILKHIRNVQWKYSDTLVPDYCMSRNACAFFLSMKYHLLNPTYIHQRLRELGRAYDLRVLLVFVDVKEPRHCIKELEKISIHSNLTMILCWNSEEVGRYLETYKAYEFKGPEAIMEKGSLVAHGSSGSSHANSNQNLADTNFISNYTDFLCQIKSINKTDSSTLRQTFGSIRELSKASKQELNLCPGLGPLKVNRLHEIFRTPFLLTKK
jgi:DNA excision repair protein ERCC-1